MKKDFKILKEDENRINKILELRQKNTDISLFKEMKNILDVQFGKDNNQIIKMGPIDVLHLLSENAGQGVYREGGVPDSTFIGDRIVGGYMILIKFPEVTVKNSNNNSITIKDLYVRLLVDQHAKLVSDMNGTRTTMTQSEINARYLHSHLSTDGCYPIVRFTRFCVGTGEITQAMSVWRTEFSSINFTLFCLHLKSYIAWESLEGVPHVKMGNVRRRSTLINLPTLFHQSVKGAVDILYSELLELADEKIKSLFTYSMTKTEFIASPTEELELFLAKKIEAWEGYRMPTLLMAPRSFLASKDSVGKYYVVETQTAVRTTQADPILLFKGDYQYLKLVDTTNELKPQNYAHPQITQELCRRVSQFITKTAFKIGTDTINRDPSTDIRETTESGDLPMQ